MVRISKSMTHSLIYVGEGGNGCSIPQLVSLTALGNDLAMGILAYSERQQRQSIFFINATLDGDLCGWLNVGL